MKPIPKLNLNIPVGGMPGLIYLGCNNGAGHHFYLPGMIGLYSQFREAYEKNYHMLVKLDGAFAPQDTENEGEAWFHSETVNGFHYRVISFWDRSVDSRPGSNSTFFLAGNGSFNEAIADCRAGFPEVFRRYKFEVKLKRNMFIKQTQT